MLVSHRHKFIYTKTVKTAGTSVEAYFERFCMPESAWTPSHRRDAYATDTGIIGYRGPNPPSDCEWWHHMPAEQIREKVGADIWDSYFKFCVIRNPYEKAISSFYFFQQQPMHKQTHFEDEPSRFECWLDSCTPPIDRDKYLLDDKFCLDDVIRHETLEADMERICNRLNIPWDAAYLPTYKSGLRPRHASARNRYTDKSTRIVSDTYDFEIDYFNYAFPAA
jgi:hypothetical protein